jgi:hypothetical protein
MLPVSLVFTSGVASGVNCYAAVLVLGLLGRFGHVAAVSPVLERPSVLAAAAVLYIGQFVVGKIPMLDSVWDVVHTALRPVVGGVIGVVMAQHADASSAATLAAAALGGGSALASHVVKTGMRVGVNASPEPFSNIAASLLEDLGVAGLVSFAVFHPVAGAAVAAVALAVGIALFALLASRIRQGRHRRRDARPGRRPFRGPIAGVPSPQRQDVTTQRPALELALEPLNVAGVLPQLLVGGAFADAGQGPANGFRAVVRDTRGDQRVHDVQLRRPEPDHYVRELTIGGLAAIFDEPDAAVQLLAAGVYEHQLDVPDLGPPLQ